MALKDVVEFLVQSLVEHPDQVTITEVEKEDETVLEVRVAPEDMGRVIGKQGRVAKALRTVTKAAAMKHGKKVYVDIVD